jgi:hypothetical protein
MWIGRELFRTLQNALRADLLHNIRGKDVEINMISDHDTDILYHMHVCFS